MDRDLDMKIAQQVYGWNTYEPVASDAKGENAGRVLVPYAGYSDWLFAQGYSYNPKGMIAECIHVPCYTRDYDKALELAKKVQLPIPAHSMPTRAHDLAKKAYEYHLSKSSDTAKILVSSKQLYKYLENMIQFVKGEAKIKVADGEVQIDGFRELLVEHRGNMEATVSEAKLRQLRGLLKAITDQPITMHIGYDTFTIYHIQI